MRITVQDNNDEETVKTRKEKNEGDDDKSAVDKTSSENIGETSDGN